jgi:DNA anti-recombination protein RmuC
MPLFFCVTDNNESMETRKTESHCVGNSAKGGSLYDTFVTFYEQMQALGECIRKTQQCYDDSLNKLKTGRENLIRHDQGSYVPAQIKLCRKI